ncbi:MAG: T9SS type A sorting domain-containing protein [Ignavibacteria bacterium]|nr:T9SS type A sorting domain-containing protein [Ignavibacteria bacterium]
MKAIYILIASFLITQGLYPQTYSKSIYYKELKGEIKNTLTGLPVSNGFVKLVDYSTTIPTEVKIVSVNHSGVYRMSEFVIHKDKIDNFKILAYPSDMTWDFRLGLSGNGVPVNGQNSLITVIPLSDAISNGENNYNLDIKVTWIDKNKKFELVQNYPNPFNPSTSIGFLIPISTNISLKIYNSIGEEVKVFADNEFFSAGSHSFIFEGSDLPSGIYFYELKSTFFNDIKKMILIK